MTRSALSSRSRLLRRMAGLSPTCELGFLAACARSKEIAADASKRCRSVAGDAAVHSGRGEDKNPVLCITGLNCLSMQVLRFCFSAVVFVSEVVFDCVGPCTPSPRFGEAELIRSLSVRPLQESFGQRESTPTPAARRNKCL